MSFSTPGSSSQGCPSKLTCARVTELIDDYVMGDLAPDTDAAFETHLHRCQDCEAFLNTYRRTIQATGKVCYEAIPPEMLNRIHHFLNEHKLDL